MSLKSSLVIVLLPFLFLSFIDSTLGLPPKFFDVRNYGAIADGETDNSQAFLRTWKDACAYGGRSRFFVAPGLFMLGSVTFEGPCSGTMAFIVKGTLKAPTQPNKFMTDTWIGFRYLNGLTVKGGGYLDGQGPIAWPYNDCSKNSNCGPLPVSLRLDFVNNSRIHHLKSIDSKNTHFSLFACHNLNISHVRITAPGDSPNTDGIRIGVSRNIKISRSVIGTGDDCIAMLSGSQDIDIYGISCGPGHGISIGSIGRGHEDEYVSGIRVRKSRFGGTDNGVRIKTWAPSSYTLATNISFEYLYMQNVANPIIIDQHYCPSGSCGASVVRSSSSAVQIQNVKYSDIWGTSRSRIAVNMQCSDIVPCRNIELSDIDLVYRGREGPAISQCSNVRGSAYGEQRPPSCL